MRRERIYNRKTVLCIRPNFERHAFRLLFYLWIFFRNGAVLSAGVSDEVPFEEDPDGILSLDELMESVIKWPQSEKGVSGENTYHMILTECESLLIV